MPPWNLESAQTAYEQGKIQDWIEAYLQVPEWENLGLLRRVREYSTSWLAPQLIELDRLVVVAGPGPAFKFPKDPLEWANEVGVISRDHPAPDDLPPMIAWIDPDSSLNLADGNHRRAALMELGYLEGWVLVHEGPLRSKEEISLRLGL